MDKMETLISGTKAYLRGDKLQLEKLQDIETKLDTLKGTYRNLIDKTEDPGEVSDLF